MQLPLGGQPPSFAVPSPEEFYREWFPKVVVMARFCHDPEDVAQDVILAFLRSGYLDRWDVTKGRSFKNFCMTMLRHRITSALRKQQRLQNHESLAGEMVYFDAPLSSNEVDWVEDLLDWRRLADSLESELARHGDVGGNLVPTLRCMADMAEEGQPIHARVVGERMGRSETAIRARVNVMREELRAFL